MLTEGVREPKHRLMQKLFDPVAGEYDLLLAVLTLGQCRYWLECLKREVHSAGARRVLDVATGTGRVVDALRDFPSIEFMIGLDLSALMLQYARKQNPDKRVFLVRGVAEHLPFRPSVFDCVTTSLSLRNLTDLRAFVRESRRALTAESKSKLIALDFTRPNNRFLLRLYYLYLSRFMPLIGGLVSPEWNRLLRYLERSIMQFLPPQRVAELMREDGFLKADYQRLTGGITTIFVAST